MFKHNPLVKAIEDVIDVKLKAVDEFIDRIVEPLASVGNPEKLIGKPYEQWTDVDRMTLYKIYGAELESYIFRKEMKAIDELKREVI